MAGPRPIVPSFVVQEEGSRKVLVYVNIPELKVKRSFPNFTKQIPLNGDVKRPDFQDQSFTFTINVQTKQNETKIYSLAIARLPGEIEPERCSIKYQRGGCWLTLIKLEPMSWMNRICDGLNPGLDVEENDSPTVSAPVQEQQLRDTNMPPPFNSVPIAPYPPYRPPSTKSSAPPPPPPPRSTGST